MKHASARRSTQNKKCIAQNLYQSSRSRYVRAFAAARAMRFWRPRLSTKKLKLAAVFAAALAMTPSEVHAQFPALVDLGTLDGTNGFVISGSRREHRLGRSVSDAGDVNGDGIGDLIIGATGGDPNGIGNAGESYVVFGRNSGFSASLHLGGSISGSTGFVINGIDPSDQIGGSVSGAGDFNGDGFDDVIIATETSFGQSGEPGHSYVVFGNNSGLSPLNLIALDGTNGFVINGIDITSGDGGSVSGAGDVNGDGFDDVIIGVSSASPNGEFRAGASYVVFGDNSGFSASFDLSVLNGLNGFKINGIDADDRSGFVVSGAGDINGDGLDDLLIGSRAGPYVVFGNSSGFSPTLDLGTLNGSNGFVIEGVTGGRGAGDINGDGLDDLIVGRGSGVNGEGVSYVVFGKSSAFSSSLNISTLNGPNGFAINGIDPDDGSGSGLSGAGDVNGDGIDDLFIGASNADSNGFDNAGESYVVFGKNGGFSPSFQLSTLDGTNGFTIDGGDGYDAHSLSNAGDVNGDGFDDLIIGTFQFYNSGFGCCHEGRSYVVFGRASVPEPLLGDVDQNGVINFFDIAPFISILTSNGYLEEADINEDEVVNFIDINPFIDVLSSQQ